MRFYLNNLSNRVYVEVAPQITETFDESLDSATVNLMANDNPIPYAPNQYFYICDDNDNILYTMILALDMVETYSSKPLRYRHTLTLTQNTRNIAKNTVRNSVFTQPMNEYKKGYSAFLNWLIKYDVSNFRWDYDNNAWIEPINIFQKEVLEGDFILKAKIVGVKTDGSNAILFYANYNDIFEDSNTTIRIKLYESGNDTNVYYDLSSDELGQEISVVTFYNYIKNHPTGSYSLMVDFKPFVTKEWETSTIGTTTPTQFTLQLEYKVKIYNYNCYDLLELLLERQQQKNSRYGKVKLFTLPETGELHDLLVNTIPPNFTFTANNMYECIADIFKLFDAIFTLDNNNVLGIEYLNEYQSENTSEIASTRSTHAEENYNRGIVNFYQDARVLERYPSGKGYARARSSGLGVPTSTSDFCILLPHKIEYIDKVEMLNPLERTSFIYFMENGTQAGLPDRVFHYEDDIAIDIGSFVLESSIWSLLSSGDLTTIQNNQEKVQANTTYYQKGDNKIMLGLTYQNGVVQTTNYNFNNILTFAFYRFLGIYNTNDAANTFDLNGVLYATDFTLIKTAVTYMASVDGKLEIESINPKYNGEIFVDQSNGAVDLNKLGLNMYGLALKLGEPTLTKTMQITDFANRIRKGQYIIENGEKWLANVITHTILDKGKVQSVVNFVKNYNALSLFTRVNKEKRMSTIAPDLINKSEILFGEYLYFSANGIPYSYQSETKMVMPEVCQLFAATFKFVESETHRVDYAIVNSYDKSEMPYTFNDNGTTKNVENIAIPLVRYGAGNSICLEASFSHPKSAGNKTVDNFSWWGGNAYFTNFVPYTDENGFVDKIDYKIYYKVTESDFNEYPIIDTTNTDTVVIDLEKLVIDKFPNEIFAINYQMHLMPINERKEIDFVGSAFINNNAMVKDPDNKKFYVYVSNSYIYSILDTKGVGTRHLITDLDWHSTNNAFDITFYFDEIDNTDLVSWAICDENGNIYFASNSQPDTEYVKFYFACRNQRIEDYELELYYQLYFIVGDNVTVRGNIGGLFVNYPAGTVVNIALQEGTQYSLHTEFAEHWYSDESSWDEESGVITSDVNLGVSSSGLQEKVLTINWKKNIIDVTVGGITYTNPDPSDDYLLQTHVYARQGQSLTWEVTDVEFGYYADPASGTWDTNNNLSITPVAYQILNDLYFTINTGIKEIWFKLGDDNWTYRPRSGFDDVIRDIPYWTEIEWYAVPETGYQLQSGVPSANAHAFFNMPDNDVTLNPTAEIINYNLVGTSQNGTVKFYPNSAYVQEITSADYGTTVYFKITANPGYNLPATSQGAIVVDENNFTLSNNTASKTFDPCTIQTFNVSFSAGTGATLYYSTNEGSTWTSVIHGSSPTINVNYGQRIWWYGTIDANSHYELDSNVPNGYENARLVVVTTNTSLSASTYPKTYTLLPDSISHGTIAWYPNSAYVSGQEITSADYGTTVYYKVVAAQGYHIGSNQSTTQETGSKVVNTSYFSFNESNNRATALSVPTININTYSVTINKGSNIISIVYSTDNGSTWTTSSSTVSLTLNYGTRFYWYANIPSGYEPSSSTPSSQSNAEYIYINSDVSRTASATQMVLASVSCSGIGTKNAQVYVVATTAQSITVTQVKVYYGVLERVIFTGSQTISGYGGYTFTGTTTINLADGDYAEVSLSNGQTVYGYF